MVLALAFDVVEQSRCVVGIDAERSVAALPTEGRVLEATSQHNSALALECTHHLGNRTRKGHSNGQVYVIVGRSKRQQFGRQLLASCEIQLTQHCVITLGDRPHAPLPAPHQMNEYSRKGVTHLP